MNSTSKLSDYVNLKPPASTKSYRSADRIVALEHFDADAILDVLGPTYEEFDAMRIGTSIMQAFSTSRGRRSSFPSPADVVDVQLRGYAEFDEPVWDDYAERERSVWMLRCIDRLRDMLDESKFDTTEKTLTCPACSKKTVKVTLHPLMVYDGAGVVFDTTELGMSQLDVTCDCHEITVEDIYEFERSALADVENDASGDRGERGYEGPGEGDIL